jgi:hypothetical protein
VGKNSKVNEKKETGDEKGCVPAGVGCMAVAVIHRWGRNKK